MVNWKFIVQYVDFFNHKVNPDKIKNLVMKYNCQVQKVKQGTCPPRVKINMMTLMISSDLYTGGVAG